MTLKLDAKSGDYTATCALNKRKYFLRFSGLSILSTKMSLKTLM